MRSHISAQIIKMTGANRYLPLALVLTSLFSSCSSGSQDATQNPLSNTSAKTAVMKPSDSRASVDEQCVENLLSVYRLLRLWLHRTGRLDFPSNLELLYPWVKEPKPFICPEDKELEAAGQPDTFRTSYEIVNNPLESKFAKTSANRIAIVTEKRANHQGQRFVLFYDGSVRAFDVTQFDKLKGCSFIDADTNH